MKTKFRSLVCLVLVLAMVLSAAPLVSAVSVAPPSGKVIINKTDYTIVDGVTESHITMNSASGDAQIMSYMTTIEPGAKVTFKASYSGYYTKGSTIASRKEKIENGSLVWAMEQTSKQAANFEKATGGKVLVATNGDFYNMATAQPLGYLIMEGNVMQTGNGSAQEPYFAVLKDGSFVIRDYGTPHDDVVEAISGPFYLVKDGQMAPGLDGGTLLPTNSIGIKEDGTVITFLADGRQAPMSVGMTLREMANMHLAQGVKTAIYLDGGGSATYVSRHEGESKLQLRNSPSDGPERVVSSALLLVSTEESTGVFDHASLSPNNTLYTPGSTVQFSAIGVDAMGGSAELPQGCTWSVADAACGSIDADGLFTAKAGFTGTVTVRLNKDGNILGETQIQIEELDQLDFGAAALNLDFKQTSDLNLITRSNGRSVTVKEGDIHWTIQPTGASAGLKPEEIGAFNGNLFTSVKAKETLYATITASYQKIDGSVLTANLSVEIGKMPVVIFDFEEDEDGNLPKSAIYDWGVDWYGGAGYLDENTTIRVPVAGTFSDNPTYQDITGPFLFNGNWDSTAPAAPIFRSQGYSFYTWHTPTVNIENAYTAEIVDESNGQVRFGGHAMKLNYDYTSFNGGRNYNEYLRYCGEDINVEGAPTALGMWVYAPKGTPNYWLWTTIGYWSPQDEDYAFDTVHFTTQTGKNIQTNGICWEGWMYVEADLTKYAQYVTSEHPLKIFGGMPLLLLTYIPGGSPDDNGASLRMGAEAKGSIYIDNVRFVYGSTNDDLNNPAIESFKANDVTIDAGGSTVLEQNSLRFTVAYSDPQDENTSGINTEKTHLAIDGRNVDAEITETGATFSTVLPNGSHSVKITVTDHFGNVSTETRYFTVRESGSKLATVSLTAGEAPVLGKSYVLKLTADEADYLDAVQMTAEFSDLFGEPTVTVGNGYSGITRYDDGILTLDLNKNTASAGRTIATVTFQVPETVARNTPFYYTVDSGLYRCGETTLTFAGGKQLVDVSATYELKADIMVEGSTGNIYVTTAADGKPAARIPVYDGTGTLLGKTNASGILRTNRFCRTAGDVFTLYAKDEAGVSFRYNGKTVSPSALNSDGTPYNVRLNAGKDSQTAQAVTWLSDALYAQQAAVAEICTKADYDAGKHAFTRVTGDCINTTFSADNTAAYINHVTFTSLKPGVSYVFRVGDGTPDHWSDYETFTTDLSDGSVKFFIMGDTQLTGNPDSAADQEAIALMDKMAESIRKENVQFGLQTGDFVDAAASLTAWNEILSVFTRWYGSMPIVHVLGNHEYYGDPSGSISNAMLNIPSADCYSVQYDDIYIAVINCQTDLATAMEWLEKDAAESTAAWKLLTIHQPPYYTNVNGSNEAHNRIIPAVAEKAGIDFVFSGHDHSYARTEPLKDGKVDKKNGTVYFICGDLGEKSRDNEYAAVNNPDFHFAKIDQDYEGVYLIVSLEQGKMTITAHDADGSVLDSYSKQKLSECELNGHKAVYDSSSKALTCSVCGEALANYTGAATDKKTGKQMYFIDGKFKTGWFVVGDEVYHFDAKSGLPHNVSIQEQRRASCTEKGFLKAKCQCGEVYSATYGNPTGHSFVKETANDGSTIYVCSGCGAQSKINVPFIDIDDEAWYAEALEYVYQNGYFAGVDAIHFGPNEKMTRAMMVAVLWRLEGEPEFSNVNECKFTDCKLRSWYVAAVNWASKNGIVYGKTDTTFAPNEPVTREQMVSFVYRYMKYKQYDVSAKTDLSGSFKDSKAVSSYAVPAMEWAVSAGIISGNLHSDKTVTLDPQNTCLRSQLASVIYRLNTKVIAKS